MIKTYKLTTPVRNSSIVLRGKTGNRVRYNFSGGDPLTNKPATIMLRSLYSQTVLEEDDIFKKGYVRLVKIDEGGEFSEAPKVEETIVEEVNSPEALLEFVASQLEKPYNKPKAALSYAEKMGFKFPNLTLE